MKVVVNEYDRLILEDTPTLFAIFIWLMGLLLLGMAATHEEGFGIRLLLGLLGLGITAAAWKFFPFQRIPFSRSDNQITRRIARVTGAKTETLMLTEFERAASQGNWSNGTRMERVVLLSPAGAYPLEFVYSSTTRKPVIDAINIWMAADAAAT